MGLMFQAAVLSMSALIVCTAALYSPATPGPGKGDSVSFSSSREEESYILPITVRIPETEGIADFLLTGPKIQKQTVTTPNGEKTAVELRRESGEDWTVSWWDSDMDFHGSYTLRLSDGKVEKAFGQASECDSYVANHYFAYNSISARAVFRFAPLSEPKVEDGTLKAVPLTDTVYRPSQPQANMITISVYGVDANLVSGNRLKVTFYHARETIRG